jgi:hypothetical protein
MAARTRRELEHLSCRINAGSDSSGPSSITPCQWSGISTHASKVERCQDRGSTNAATAASASRAFENHAMRPSVAKVSR